MDATATETRNECTAADRPWARCTCSACLHAEYLERDRRRQEDRRWDAEYAMRRVEAQRHDDDARRWREHFRDRLTGRDLLRVATERRAAADCVARGGKFYESAIGTRAAAIEAVAVLKARADRRSLRGSAEKARRADPGRIVRLQESRRRQREAEAAQKLADRLAAGKLGAGRVRKLHRDGKLLAFAAAGHGRRRETNTAGVVRCLVAAVGRIGDQCEADLVHFAAGEEFSGKRGRHHKLEGSELSRVEARKDWTAALVTMRDYCSFGSGTGTGYESRGGSSCRCYLVVRDATSGEAHVLRVPPKFGNSKTKFFERFRDQAAEQLRQPPAYNSTRFREGAWDAYRRRVEARAVELRIQAAVAWTFGLAAGEYRPTREA